MHNIISHGRRYQKHLSLLHFSPLFYFSKLWWFLALRERMTHFVNVVSGFKPSAVYTLAKSFLWHFHHLQRLQSLIYILNSLYWKFKQSFDNMAGRGLGGKCFHKTDMLCVICLHLKRPQMNKIKTNISVNICTRLYRRRLYSQRRCEGKYFTSDCATYSMSARRCKDRKMWQKWFARWLF